METKIVLLKEGLLGCPMAKWTKRPIIRPRVPRFRAVNHLAGSIPFKVEKLIRRIVSRNSIM
jgi:hypothetical protein